METAPLQPKRSPVKIGLSVLLLAWTSAMTVIRAVATGSPHDGPSLLGQAAGPILVVGLIVWLMGRRKTNRRPLDARLLMASAGVCLLTVFSLGSALGSVAAQAPRPIDKMERLGRAAMEDFLQGMAAINQDYVEASRALQTPDMDALYTPASYATREVTSNIITQLEQQGELDRRYNAAVDALFARVRAGVEAARWPAGQKAGFLGGFDEGFKNSSTERRQFFAADHDLRQAAIDLYQFALEHQDHFSIQALGQIAIDDPDARHVFQQKAEAVDRLRAAFEDARAEYLQYQERVKRSAAAL